MFTQAVEPFACVKLSEAARTVRWFQMLRVCRQVTPLLEEHPARRALILALGGSVRLLLGGMQAPRAGSSGEQAEAPEVIWARLGEALALQLTDEVYARGPESRANNQEKGGVGDSGASRGTRDTGAELAIGIGPTRTLAWLAAKISAQAMTSMDVAPAVIVLGEDYSLLTSEPVALLRDIPDAGEIVSLAEILAILEEAGIRTLGQLHRLPANALIRRFGRVGALLATLAAGSDLRPLRLQPPEPWLGARLTFEPPLVAEQLPIALAPLAEKLALTLTQRDLAAEKVTLVLESETGMPLRVERRLAHPLGTTRALLDIAERLLTGLLVPVPAAANAAHVADAPPDVELPAAGERYVALRLRVGGLHPSTAEQRQLWAGEQRKAGGERVNRLTAALRAIQSGKHADALLRAEVHAPDAVVPEERYRLTPRSPRTTRTARSPRSRTT